MKTTQDPFDLEEPAPEEQVEIIRLGKDEMNLAEFPITLLSDRVPKGKQSIQYQDQIFDEKTGKRITRKLTIKAPDEDDGKSGLPTATDNDVILGLIQLTKMANNFTSREVEFSRLDFIRLLGWPDSGDSYARLGKSLKRWLSVTLLYENAWRDNRKGAWLTKGFHILDNIELNDTRTLSVQGELFPSKIIWNKVVFESFEAGYLKSIDYGLYVKLRHSIAKQLYRFLSKRMYFGPALTFDLYDLAFAHVGLSETYKGNAAKIKEKLQPAIEELEEFGFLEPMAKEERYKKEGKNWIIRLVAKAKSPAPTVAPASAEPPLLPLVAALVDRGVTTKTAAALVQLHPSEAIEIKLEVFDWLKERNDRRIDKNPAGYLVKSIKDDYAVPEEFTTRANRARQADLAFDARQSEAEKRRRKQRDDAREEAHRRAVDARLKQLDADQRADLEAKALAAASPEARANYESPMMARYRETLMIAMLRDYLQPIFADQMRSASDA